MLPTRLFAVADKAITAVKKYGPDPVVFIFCVLVFIGLAPLIVRPGWAAYLGLMLTLGLYCWRRNVSEKHDITLAQLNYDTTQIKLREIKSTHARTNKKSQAELPLNPGPGQPSIK